MRKFIPLGVLVALAITLPALAQNAQAQPQVAALKAAIAKNSEMLAQYTWQQIETVSVNGDVKKQTEYQVQLGPNGLQKVQETPNAPQGRQGFIKRHMEANYEQYGEQIAALAQSYAQPSPGKIQHLYQQGLVTLGSGGAPGIVAIHIHNYVKQGDSVTILLNKAQKAINNISVASYLSDPSDAVTINARFAQLADGTDYVQKLTVNGSSKNMVVTQVNSEFQKR